MKAIVAVVAMVWLCCSIDLIDAGDAGILYEVWHGHAATAMATVAKMGGQQLTTELVIRSNGTLTLNDVYQPYNLSADIYNVQPQLGFYCLYRSRPNDTDPPPDCANITATATQHAKWLSSAGFDYVNVDITNWPVVNPDTDYTVLRPTEVLFQEWLALRQRNISTPQIAVWPCSPAGSNTWRWLLNTLYNNMSYDSLIYRQNGKKVVFLPYNTNCYDETTEQQILSNGGRNDVVTIKMWALFGKPDFDRGVWGFFSPCTVASGQFTTSMIDEPECNQFPTLDSHGNPIELSASGSYMLSQVCGVAVA